MVQPTTVGLKMKDGARSQECRQLEAGKGKEMILPWSFQKGKQASDFSPVRLLTYRTVR